MAQITSGSLTIVDVTDGAPGLNNTTVFLYRRAVNAPDKPTGNLTYTFSTASITGTLEGWVQSISELTGSDPIWMIAAVASSNGETDVIGSSEWAGPIKMAQNGQDGLPGAPGTPGTNGLNQATIFIYKRDDSATAPSNTTYTFATGGFTVPSGWSKTIPTEPKGKPCWVTSAIAIGAEATTELNWATPSVLVEDGSDGVSPTVTATGNGVKIVDGNGNETYITNGVDGTSYYTFVRYSENSDGSGYVDTPTSETIYIGVYSGTKNSPPAYNDSGWTWSRYVGANGQPGTPGSQGPQGVSVAATRELYYLKTNSTDPAQITNANQIHATDDVNQWTSVVPTYIGSGKYYTCIETTLSNGNIVWSAPVENKGLTDANVNAANAIEIARGVKQHFFWVATDKSANIPAGAYVAEESEESFYSNPTKGNILTRSDGIWIRNGVDKLATLQGSGLTFLVPTGTYKGQKSVSLNGSGLTFYNIGSSNSAAATLASDGLQITNGSIVLGTTSGTSAGNVTLSNKNFTRSINGTSHNDLRFAIGSKFGVASDGTLYASNADINGVLTAGANSKIGPWNVTDSSIWYGNSTFGNANGIYLGTSGLSLGSAFQVTNTGIVTANNITVTGGKIGGWNIGTDTNKSLYYGNQVPGATASNLVLSPISTTNTNAIAGSETGKTWFISAGQKFGVDTSGNLYATGAKISGEVNITAGNVYTKTESDEALGGKVGNNEVITKINASSEGVQIQASKVDIAGAAVFNNYSTTTEMNTAINTAVDTKKSVHTLTSSNTSGATYATILGYANEGTSTSFGVVSNDGVKVGDSVRLAYKVSDMTGKPYVYINGTVTAVNANGTNITMTGHGLDTTIIDGGNILTGSIGASKIKVSEIEIGAAQITSGTIATARIPDLSADKIQSGTIAVGRLPADALNSNVKVGGRNMLGNTSNKTLPTCNNSIPAATFGHIGRYNSPMSEFSLESYDGASNTMIITSSTTGNRGVGWYTKPNDVIDGETYTFSCRVKTSVAATVHTHTAWRNGSATDYYTGWTSGGNMTTTANTWMDYSYTFTPSTSAQLAWEFYVALCFTGATTGITCRIAHAKLEKGNKATDWTTAPEDVVNENLLSDSQKMTGWKIGSNSLVTRSTSDVFGVITLNGTTANWGAELDPCPTISTSILDGTPLWLSFEYKASVASNIYICLAGTANTEGSYASNRTKYTPNFSYSHAATTEWLRSVIKMPTSLSALSYGSGDVNSLFVQFYCRTDNSTVQIRKVKLERGLYASEWTSSPDDYKTYLTRIDDGGIFISPASQSPTTSATGNSVKINGDGMEVYKGGNSVAFYGDTARVGKSDTRHIEIKDGGMQVYSNASTVTAHFGYGTVTVSSGTATGPYYTLGTRTGNNGLYSVAEGQNVTASGPCSHAEGSGTTASGVCSHAGGEGTIAEKWHQTAIGKYNVANTSYFADEQGLFIVGNGQSNSSRSNALFLDTNGNLRIKGDLRFKCDANSANGLTLATASGVMSSSLVDIGDVQYEYSVARVGGVCQLFIKATKGTDTAAGANLFDVALNAAVPVPSGSSTGCTYFGKYVIAFILYEGTDGKAHLRARNANSSTLGSMTDFFGGTVMYMV